MSALKKIGRVLLILLIVVLVFIATANVVKRVMNSEFYATAETKIDMPGLSEGFVPQGLDYYDGGFFVAGYMADDSASRVYYVKESGESTCIKLMKANGSDFTGHCGGVAHYGDYFYIGGSGGLYVFDLADMTDGDGVASQIGKFEAGMTASWVAVYNDAIYIGTFADGNAYTAADWQSCKTPAGDENPSMMVKFLFDEESDTYGIKEAPECAWSMRHWVQGAAITADGIILSTSSGINSSVFYFYEYDDSYCGEVLFGGAESESAVNIPLYYLDSRTLTYQISAIPMAEEIEVVGNRLYIANESACSKYLFGILIGGESFYSIELKDRYFGK